MVFFTLASDRPLSQYAGLLLGICFAYVGLGKLMLLGSGFPSLDYAHVELSLIPSVFVPLALEVLLHSTGLVYVLLGLYVLLAAAAESAYWLWLASSIERHLESLSNTQSLTAFFYIVGFCFLRVLLLWTAVRVIWFLSGSEPSAWLALDNNNSSIPTEHRCRTGRYYVRLIRGASLAYAALLAVELGMGIAYELHLTLSLFFPYAVLGIAALLPYKHYGSLYVGVVITLASTVLDFGYLIWLALQEPEAWSVSSAVLVVAAVARVLRMLAAGTIAIAALQLIDRPFNERVHSSAVQKKHN
jgi:hypothetical protein